MKLHSFSIRSLCKSISYSPSNLSNFLKKDKNSEYIQSLNLSSDTFLNILKALNFKTQEVQYMLLLKEYNEANHKYPSSSVIVKLKKENLKNFKLKKTKKPSMKHNYKEIMHKIYGFFPNHMNQEFLNFWDHSLDCLKEENNSSYHMVLSKLESHNINISPQF